MSDEPIIAPALSLPVVKHPSPPTPTDIEWATHSWNPHRAIDPATGKVGWACVKVSPGCANCYAESINLRFGTERPFTKESIGRVRVVLDHDRVAAAMKWRPRPPEGAPPGWRPRVFVGDMVDLFGGWVSAAALDPLFLLFAVRDDIDWLLLTKRPDRMAAYLRGQRVRRDVLRRLRLAAAAGPNGWAELAPGVVRGSSWVERWGRETARLDSDDDRALRAEHGTPAARWPLANVWCGVSVEDQPRAETRVAELLATNAAVRFVSAEPLLGPVDFERIRPGRPASHHPARFNALTDCPGRGLWFPADGPRSDDRVRARRIDWVIVGCESKSGRVGRIGPMDERTWCRVVAAPIVAACRRNGVAVFVKQIPMNGRVSGNADGFHVELRAREYPNIRSEATA